MALKTVEMVREIREAIRAETEGLNAGDLVAYYTEKAGLAWGQSHRQKVREVHRGQKTSS